MDGENAGTATVGTSSVSVLPKRNGERGDYIVTNNSAAGQKVTLRRGEIAAAAGEGIILNQGESWVESTDAGMRCFQGTISAIADAAGAVLAFSERVLQ